MKTMKEYKIIRKTDNIIVWQGWVVGKSLVQDEVIHKMHEDGLQYKDYRIIPTGGVFRG